MPTAKPRARRRARVFARSARLSVCMLAGEEMVSLWFVGLRRLLKSKSINIPDVYTGTYFSEVKGGKYHPYKTAIGSEPKLSYIIVALTRTRWANADWVLNSSALDISRYRWLFLWKRRGCWGRFKIWRRHSIGKHLRVIFGCWYRSSEVALPP